MKEEFYTFLNPEAFSEMVFQRKGELVPIRVLECKCCVIPGLKYYHLGNFEYLLDNGELRYYNPQNIVSVCKGCFRVSDHVLEGDRPYRGI